MRRAGVIGPGGALGAAVVAWGLLLGAAGCEEPQGDRGLDVTPLGGQQVQEGTPSGEAKRRRRVEPRAATTRPGGGVAGRPSAVEVQSAGRGAAGGGSDEPGGGGGDEEEWTWEPPGQRRRASRPRMPKLDIEACDRYGREACRCRNPRRAEAACAGAAEVLRTWKRMLELPGGDRLTAEERGKGGERGLDMAREAVRAEAERACKEALREVRRLCRAVGYGSD